MKSVIIVTGAASGMGKEFILQILTKETNIDEIWAVDRDEKGLLELKEKVSDKIIPLKIDLTNENDLLKYKEKMEKEKPNVIILVNCAGFGVFDHSENIDTEVKLNMIDLNVKAPVTLIDYTLPYMKEKLTFEQNITFDKKSNLSLFSSLNLTENQEETNKSLISKKIKINQLNYNKNKNK